MGGLFTSPENADAKQEGYPAADQSAVAEVVAAQGAASKTLASIEVAYLSGKTMVQLTEGVEKTVSVFKKRVAKEAKLEPMMEVDLLLDGAPLPHTATLAAAGLEAGKSYTLTGILEQHWILDESKKGEGVELLGNGQVKNTTPSKCMYAEGSCRIILGKQCLPQGRHHFRVRLCEGEFYYIGVAEEGVNLNTYLGAEKGRGWSFYLRDNKTGSRLGPGYKNFGTRLETGDTVTFCFDTVKGTLEIQRGAGELELAQSGLQGKDLFFALGMGPNGVSLQLEDAWREQ